MKASLKKEDRDGRDQLVLPSWDGQGTLRDGRREKTWKMLLYGGVKMRHLLSLFHEAPRNYPIREREYNKSSRTCNLNKYAKACYLVIQSERNLSHQH